ncbi:MAG: hypothetical protein ACLRWQ_10975 [Flavonifractor plautii]
MDGAYEATEASVFGVVGSVLARACEKDKDAMLARPPRSTWATSSRPPRTFKVETKRADKTFPMTSIQLAASMWAGSSTRPIPNLERGRPPPRAHRLRGGAGLRRLRPRRARARRRRPARGHQRPGGELCCPAASTPRWPPG